MENSKGALKKEAEAFDKRISERLNSGFIPDLRRAVKCEYFFKSFWREPLFIRLYLGKIVETFLELTEIHCGRGLSILDVGCGSGLVSLELARNGYHVTGIDISKTCIEVALKALEENPYIVGFGSLEYQVMPFLEVSGTYDIILFCGSLHHMLDVQEAVDKAFDLLPPKGHLLCHEPSHEEFRKQDAAQVALIRSLLSLTGLWYDSKDIVPLLSDEDTFVQYVNDIHTEYVLERDKDEPAGQSPHDLEANGEEILYALRSRFTEIEVRPSFSFIYRLLGGIRGPERMVHGLANFITLYDLLSVRKGYLGPNYFYFLGQKEG